MGRWSQYDEDEHRLPEGFKRVAYDADSGRHYFRDAKGAIWEGPEGAEFGEMKRVSGPPVIIESEEDLTDLDVESVGRSHAPQPAPSPYRTLFPFILIIFACLLLVWRLVLAPSYSPAPAPAPTPVCPDHTEPYAIRDGDTCWALGQARGLSVDQVIRANPGLECTRLRPGQRVCLPLAVDRRAATTKTRARQ